MNAWFANIYLYLRVVVYHGTMVDEVDEDGGLPVA